MGFVNEKISDEDKENYGIEPIYNYWTIDRDNDTFLTCVGGVREATFFEMYYKSYTIRINTELKTFPKDKRINNKIIYDVIYNFHSIHIPEVLRENKEQIVNSIKNSLEVWGFAGNTECTNSVGFENLSKDSILFHKEIKSKIRR